MHQTLCWIAKLYTFSSDIIWYELFNKFIQILMCTLQLGFKPFMTHMSTLYYMHMFWIYLHIKTLGAKTSMFQQMIKNYITFYSLLFSFNMFVQIHYKDSCIAMTLHTPHKKFIVNKYNFKWNYHSLGMIPYHLYVVYHNYKFFGLNLSMQILWWYMIMIENIRSRMYIVSICKVIEHFIIYLWNSNHFKQQFHKDLNFVVSTSFKYGNELHTIMVIYGNVCNMLWYLVVHSWLLSSNSHIFAHIL
jgi:hypothetical protein